MDYKNILTNLKKINMKVKNINEKFPFAIIELENEETKETKFAIGCLGIRTNPKYNTYEEAEKAINQKDWEPTALLCEAIAREIINNQKQENNGNN